MSRLHIPSPHSFTQKRPTSTLDANGRKVIGVPTEIEVGIPGMMCPAGTGSEQTAFGVMETMNDIIVLEAVDDNDDPRVVQAGDLLIDEDTNNVWEATAPGNTYQNPSLFRRGLKIKHHLDVVVIRADPETTRLAG